MPLDEYGQRQIAGIEELYKSTFGTRAHNRFERGRKRMEGWSTHISPLDVWRHNLNRLSAVTPWLRTARFFMRMLGLFVGAVVVLAALAVILIAATPHDHSGTYGNLFRSTTKGAYYGQGITAP